MYILQLQLHTIIYIYIYQYKKYIFVMKNKFTQPRTQWKLDNTINYTVAISNLYSSYKIISNFK